MIDHLDALLEFLRPHKDGRRDEGHHNQSETTKVHEYIRDICGDDHGRCT